MSQVFISAAHKSSGKTTVSIGLCAALSDRGYGIQPFKKGPDYIDTQWLAQASGQPVFNLDFYTQSPDEIRQLWLQRRQTASLQLIEGNKGLYDGVDPKGSDCNAALAALLDTPIILVIDCSGMTRGIAPLLNGYLAFAKEITLMGVILNKVASSRHEAKLRQAIEHYCNIEVFGAIYRDRELAIDERHLGLVPGYEHGFAREKIAKIQAHIENGVDIKALIERLNLKKSSLTHQAKPRLANRLRIGIAKDQAFGFYYHDDLEAFAAHQVDLVTVDLIRDRCLPDLQGLFIGGGFPEMNLHQLANNRSMRVSIKEQIDQGLPVYAECGGLMYLCQEIRYRQERAPMVGVISGDILMHDCPQGRGYVRLQSTGCAPWQVSERDIRAHEFHYASLINLGQVQFAYQVKRGYGINGQYDGIVDKNVVASFSHLRSTQASPWVSQFVNFVQQQNGGI